MLGLNIRFSPRIHTTWHFLIKFIENNFVIKFIEYKEYKPSQ